MNNWLKLIQIITWIWNGIIWNRLQCKPFFEQNANVIMTRGLWWQNLIYFFWLYIAWQLHMPTAKSWYVIVHIGEHNICISSMKTPDYWVFTVCNPYSVYLIQLVLCCIYGFYHLQTKFERWRNEFYIVVKNCTFRGIHVFYLSLTPLLSLSP